MAMIRKRVGKKKGTDGKIRKTTTWQAVVRRGDHKLVKDKLVRVPMNGKDLAISSGIKEDKGRVAMGLPNVIKGNGESIKSMTAMFEGIAKQVQERLAKQANSIPGECEEVE